MIISPNRYKLNHKVSRSVLINHGFNEFSERYVIRKWLYKKIVYLEIEIDFSEGRPFMRYGIFNHSIKQHYTPFYHAEERFNNFIYNEVVCNFNRYMDGLCACDVMWRKNYEPYYPRTKGRRRKNVDKNNNF